MTMAAAKVDGAVEEVAAEVIAFLSFALWSGPSGSEQQKPKLICTSLFDCSGEMRGRGRGGEGGGRGGGRGGGEGGGRGGKRDYDRSVAFLLKIEVTCQWKLHLLALSNSSLWISKSFSCSGSLETTELESRLKTREEVVAR